MGGVLNCGNEWKFLIGRIKGKVKSKVKSKSGKGGWVVGVSGAVAGGA